MSKDGVTFYNLWFPGDAGSYRVTADTNAKNGLQSISTA